MSHNSQNSPQASFGPHRIKAKMAGFTMIELLIVIVIIGVLSVIGINNFIASQTKSRDSQRKSDLNQIARSLEMYYNDKGRYPAADNGLISNLAWGSSFADTSVPNGATYMVKLPRDPGASTYYYSIETNGTGYRIYAKLENTKDIAVRKDVDGNPLTYTGTDCGSGEECNYGVASSNLSLE